MLKKSGKHVKTTNKRIKYITISALTIFTLAILGTIYFSNTNEEESQRPSSGLTDVDEIVKAFPEPEPEPVPEPEPEPEPVQNQNQNQNKNLNRK